MFFGKKEKQTNVASVHFPSTLWLPLCVCTLSSANVLVRAKPHPCSKALLIMAVLVVGGAEARPNGLGNLILQTSTLMSTSSIAL